MAIESAVADFTPDLFRRWPDSNLSRLFREMLTIYNRLYEAHLEKTGNPALSMRTGYETICGWIQQPPFNRSGLSDRDRLDYTAVLSIISNLKTSYGADWLQSLASLLGMLMHFTTRNRGARLLVNERRPKKAFSTYPNSPAVARFVGEIILTRLMRRPVPLVCNRPSDAERYAEGALDFLILDPSMESGQLLLEVALAAVRKVYSAHPPSSKAARNLTRAVLEKLCRDCLWGIDRNGLASGTVSLIFSLMGAAFRVPELAPAHLITADALEYFDRAEFPKFDAVVNNPPWGEALKPAERKRLRERFSCMRYQADTYVAFAEAAIKSLKPEGLFALILPCQVVAAQNTARLRELLVGEAAIDQIVILPRSAFADATIRGLILSGRAHPATASERCQVTSYPLVKKFSAIGPANRFTIASGDLRRAGEKSWWPLLNGMDGPKVRARAISLELLAVVVSGVHLYERGRGIPPQTADIVRKRPFTLYRPARGALPALQGRDVHEFHLNSPRQFIKFGRWLAHTGKHESYRRSTRIFVRELCRRDGKMTAAVATDGLVPLHGVLTVVPKMINAHALAGILNSTMAAEYVSHCAASFSKVDFQKITVGELRQMPIPLAALNSSQRRGLGLPEPNERELSLYRQLVRLARRLARATTINDPKTEGLFAEINAVVSTMYILSEDENA